ncbi:uncharacterized protein LOC134529071 [Bacillus rossius redtenbacheri]|uniref:uncharacterized protein LOC134529071 n=1 Tax=Bacillus rossius redtenbacheri TaxID=93214 RepID=UPI002FDE23C7
MACSKEKKMRTYTVEYVVTPNKRCKKCFLFTPKDFLRFYTTELTDSPDLEYLEFYDMHCLFENVPPTCIDEIEGYDDLNKEDQKLIRKYTGCKTKHLVKGSGETRKSRPRSRAETGGCYKMDAAAAAGEQAVPPPGVCIRHGPKSAKPSRGRKRKLEAPASGKVPRKGASPQPSTSDGRTGRPITFIPNKRLGRRRKHARKVRDSSSNSSVESSEIQPKRKVGYLKVGSLGKKTEKEVHPGFSNVDIPIQCNVQIFMDPGTAPNTPETTSESTAEKPEGSDPTTEESQGLLGSTTEKESVPGTSSEEIPVSQSEPDVQLKAEYRDKPMEVPEDFSSETTYSSGRTTPSYGTDSRYKLPANGKGNNELREDKLCDPEDLTRAVIPIEWGLDQFRENIREMADTLNSVSFQEEDMNVDEEDSAMADE